MNLMAHAKDATTAKEKRTDGSLIESTNWFGDASGTLTAHLLFASFADLA